MKRINIQQHLTFADKVLIGCLIVVSLASYPLARRMTKGGDTVQIEVNGAVYMVVSLHTNQTLSVSGPLGNTIVVVQDGEVFVTESPCRAKICIRTGHISHNGQLVVCVPNKVVVRVTGDEKPEYDAITQ
jgi:hypothetical protein